MPLSPRPDELHFHTQHVMPISPRNIEVSFSSYLIGQSLWCWLGSVYGQNKRLGDETPWREGNARSIQPIRIPRPTVLAQKHLQGDHCSMCIGSLENLGLLGRSITRYSETLASVEMALDGFLAFPLSVGSHWNLHNITIGLKTWSEGVSKAAKTHVYSAPLANHRSQSISMWDWFHCG